jgi:recombination protein RecR
MTPLDKLVTYFEKFPGIGGRQAKRFAFHILTLRPEQVAELAELITSLPQSVTQCGSCQRFFSLQKQQTNRLCAICLDEKRDPSKLLIVARDSDIQAIERSGVYDGHYFVLGGTIPLLNVSETNTRIRSGALKAILTEKSKIGLEEVILAFAINPDGENTSHFTEGLIRETIEGKVKISHLGRGLSTGSELEYADSETIKNALKNRD